MHIGSVPQNDPEDQDYARELRRNARRLAKRPAPELLEAPPDPFAITYRAARWEKIWLHQSLQPFFDEGLLTDVLSLVKGGKEANVYRCAGEPALGMPLVAAKVYRPREFRNLRNDQMYREGRGVLTAEGKGLKRGDHRIIRALGKKTEYGAQVQHTSWLMHEYTTLQRLHSAGAAVPQPLAPAENALLMQFIGDAERAAPALNEVALPEDEAHALYGEVLRNIELLLELGLAHGDLSAYNVLYWEGRVYLIDFPQVTPIATNAHAEAILRRDLRRVCEYFTRQGVRCDFNSEFRRLWECYAADDGMI